MSTPLKALIQERLRAKIVRQVDDEPAALGSFTVDGGPSKRPPSLIGTARLFDPSEYKINPTAKEGSPTVYDSRRSLRDTPLGFEEDLKSYNADLRYGSQVYRHRRDLNDEYTEFRRSDVRRRGGDNEPSHRLVSPVEAFTGRKRQWKDTRDGSQHGRQHGSQPDDYSSHRVIDLLPAGASRRERGDLDNFAEPKPHKNYDLSHAYQRYRVISSKHSHPGAFAPAAREDALDEPTPHWPSKDCHKPGASRRFEEDAKSFKQRDVYNWRAASMDDDVSEAACESDSTSELARERHSGYSNRRLKSSTHQRRGSPKARLTFRRIDSLVFSRRHDRCGSDFSESSYSSDSKIVFQSAIRPPPALRSPRNHQFRRQEDPAGATPLPRLRDAGDDTLSPDSHQAAKDFVAKRQKRSSQGTPRTMATHRWLESMVGTRPDTVDARLLPVMTPLTAMLGNDAVKHRRRTSTEFHEETVTRFGLDDRSDASESAISPRSSPHRRHTQEPRTASLSPVYSPPRNHALHSFSSAV